MDRRRFLALSAAAAAVLALPAEAAEPSAFTAEDADVIRGLLRVMYGEGADGIDIVTRFERSITCVDPDRQGLLRSLPGLFDSLSRVLVPTFSAWHALPPDEQVAALEDWAASTLAFRRAVHQGLRLLLLAAAYTDEQTWAEIGYPGPWLGRVEVPVHPPRFGEIS